MDVQLLVVPQCPNEAASELVLRQALRDTGLNEDGFTTVVVTEERQAARLGFVGSPTITIDGVDPFPEPDAHPALACRIYRSTDGTSGAPDLARLRQALQRATAHRDEP